MTQQPETQQRQTQQRQTQQPELDATTGTGPEPDSMLEPDPDVAEEYAESIPIDPSPEQVEHYLELAGDPQALDGRAAEGE
jgi:hypothetical protein